MIRFLIRWTITLALLVVVIFAGLISFSFYTFTKTELNISPPVLFTVNKGDDMKKIIATITNSGISGKDWQWLLLAKVKQIERSVKAGDYEVSGNITPTNLLDKLVRGEIQLLQFRIPEGKTFREIRALINNSTNFNHQTIEMTQPQILAALGFKYPNLEGLLFPDTYSIIRTSSDLDLIKLAIDKQIKILNELWSNRDVDVPFTTAYQALILASIVEKESGHLDDTPLIASVYTNRLRINMPLQADPTVIYGMGERYNGNITKTDLQTQTPYNTYTIMGLPPTPISTISKAALAAVLKPPKTNYLYFVAKGNGRSQFSETLQEHNYAVNTYILKK